MAITPESIVDPSSTTPPNSEPAPADTSGLPEEVLALPIFAGLLAGAPAAIYTPQGTKTPETLTAVKYQKELKDAGLLMYRDEPTKTDLIYNSLYLQPALIEAAAKKGKLQELASPLAEVSAQFSGAVSGGGSTPQAGGMPSSVPVDSPLDTQRKNNLVVGPATSGLAGQGRILNSIVQPVV